MIKLSDKFSLRWIDDNWELSEKIPSKHHLSKTGFKTQLRWFPTLELVMKRIFEVDVNCSGELMDLQKSIQSTLTKIEVMCKKIKK